MSPDARPDMTPLPDLLHVRSTAGPVRDRRPVYVDLLPPCNAGCPAGENIQAWLAHAEAGRHEQAWRQLTEDNPMPAIHGRVCYHPCESVCNRASLDSAVSIHSVERFLGDLALDREWLFDRPAAPPASGCWSSGPGRAACPPPTTWPGWATRSRSATRARHPGGMMRYGIPAYRLPRDVLDCEDRPHRGSRRAHHLRPPGQRTWTPSGARAASTPRSSRSARTCPSGSTSRPRTRAGSSTRCRSCTAWPRGSGR